MNGKGTSNGLPKTCAGSVAQTNETVKPGLSIVKKKIKKSVEKSMLHGAVDILKERRLMYLQISSLFRCIEALVVQVLTFLHPVNFPASSLLTSCILFVYSHGQECMVVGKVPVIVGLSDR